MNVKHNLFPKLIECRRLLGYTQSEMASIAGVSPETYKKHNADYLILDYPKCWQFKKISMTNYKQI